MKPAGLRLPEILFRYLLIGAFLGQVSACGRLPRLTILHDPLTQEQHLTLGAVYESEGDWDAALAEYRQALSRRGDKKKVYFLMGNVYYQKDKFSEAIRNYQKAERLDSQDARLYNNLAWAYFKQGMKAEAKAAASKAVLLAPDQESFQDTYRQIGEENR